MDIDSREEKYFFQIISNFNDTDDLILLIKSQNKMLDLNKQIKLRMSLVWSTIKFHKKISQTYPNFLDMIENAQKSIIFVGYAMIDDENIEILDALKNAVKQRNVSIKIIFDKTTKAKK